MTEDIRKRIKASLLTHANIETAARECIHLNGEKYSSRLYGDKIEHCCYSGNCPAQKEDWLRRPYCNLYLLREGNGEK